MRLQRWRRWARALVLGVVALVTATTLPSSARADEAAGAPPDRGAGQSHLIRIGPQMTLIESGDGKLRMYDDPVDDIKPCESVAACMLTAVQAIGGIAVLSPNAIFEGAGSVRRRALEQ